MPGLEHLEFLLDLDAKVDGAVQLLGTLDRSIATLHTLETETAKAVTALGKLDRASGQAGEKHGKHAHAAMNLGHAFEDATGKVHGMLEAMGLMVVFEGFEKLTEKVMELGGEILHAAAGAERFSKSFSFVLGAEGSEELLTWIEDIAKNTEFTDDRLKGVAASLVQVGLKGEGLRRAMAGALDIAAMPGGSLEEAIGAMARIKRTGRADNRALAPLGLGEEDFLKQLSKRTGTGVETLKKELEKGKVDTVQAMEALFDLIHSRTQRNLGAAGVEMSKTLGARLMHLKDIPDQMFQGLANTPAFQKLSDMFGEIADDLSPDGKTGKRIAAGLERAFSAATDFLADVDWDTLFNGLIDSLQTAYDIAASFASVMKDIVSGLADFTDKLGITSSPEELNKELNNDPDVIAADAKMRASERRLRELRKKQQGPLVDNPLRDMILGAEAARVPHDAGYYIGQMGAKGMVKGLKDGAPEVGKAGAEASRTGYEGGKKGIDAHSPSRLFEDLGRMSTEGYARGIEQSAGRIDGAVGDAVSPAGGSPGGGGSRMGAPTVNVHVEVNVAGRGGTAEESGERLGEQVAHAVEQILPGALESAFHRMQQEAGT